MMTKLKHIVSTGVTEETYQKLQKLAKKYNLNIAQLLRLAIELLVIADRHGILKKEKKEGEKHG